MRDIKEAYNQVKNVRARAETIIKDLGKRELLGADIENEILCAKSLTHLEQIVNYSIFLKCPAHKRWNRKLFFQYAPFKVASKSSLFERAKALGLEEAAEALLYDEHGNVNLGKYVDKSVDGISDMEKVKDGIKNIISYLFSKDSDVLELIQNM